MRLECNLWLDSLRICKTANQQLQLAQQHHQIMQIVGHSYQDSLVCLTRIRSNLESHFNTLCNNQRKGGNLTYYNHVKILLWLSMNTFLIWWPTDNIIEEDEHHVLITCPRYHVHRTNRQKSAKSPLLRNEEHHDSWAIRLAKCDEIWPLCEKDIQCKMPKERKAGPEEPNPEPYYRSRPPNPHRCWIETRTMNMKQQLRVSTRPSLG